MRLRIICIVLLLWAMPAFAGIRVALLATGSDKTTKQVVALATAQLGTDKEIELVDRESIDSALQEQKLSLSGLVETDRAIQVGKLLKADVFAVVDIDPNNGQALGLVAFDTSTGLRLADAAISGKAEQAAGTIADAVRAAVVKDRTSSNGLRLIGFLPVRNADLPPERDIFCDTLRLLLERQLTASSGIAVLERSRLEQVNKERQLPTTQPIGKLWPSLVIVQLEISRGPNGQGLKASATLTSGSGQTLDKFDAVVSGDSAADLADKLQDHLIESLKAQAISRPFNRLQEARRYAVDSTILVHNGRFEPAAEAAEAAHALVPGHENRLVLSTALWARASQYLTPEDLSLATMTSRWFDPINPVSADVEHAIGLASRALVMQDESLKAKLAISHRGQFYLDYIGGEEPITLLDGFCSRLNTVQDVDPSFQARLTEFRVAAMAYVRDYYDGWAKSIQTTPREIDSYDNETLYGIYAAASAATSFSDFAASRDHLVHQWIISFDQSWSRLGDLWMEAGLRQSQLMTTLLTTEDISTSQWTDFNRDAFHKSLRSIANDLSRSSCPIMRMYGLVAAAKADPSSSTTPEARDQTLKRFMQLFEATLDRPGSTPRRTREYAYIAAVDGISMLPPGNKSRTDQIIHLLDVAQGRRQLIPYVALRLMVDNVDVDSSASARQQWIAALEKTLDLSRAPDSHVLDANADGLRQELTSEIHDLHLEHSDVGPEKVNKPWDSARGLVDIDSLPGISRLEEFDQVVGDHVCFLGSGTDAEGKFFIQAFEVALTDASLKPLAKTFVEPFPTSNPSGSVGQRLNFTEPRGFSYSLIQGGAADEHNFYVSVCGQGVIVFPRDGSPATRLDKEHGLPSNWTQSLVAAGDILYIASSNETGAYLIEWNLKDKSLNVRVSSLRKDRKSPLDDTPGLRLEFMTNDVPRNRLLLGVAELSPSVGNGWNACKGGLWQFNTTNGRMTHLLTEDSELNFGQLRGIDHDSLFVATTLWVIQYDLSRNHGQYLSFKPGTIPPGQMRGQFREMELKKTTMRGRGWADPEVEQAAGTRRVIDNWLWIGDPFSRLSADGKTIELLDAQLAPDSQPIGPVWTMEQAGANQLILGDVRRLYVVTLHREQ